MNRRTRPTEPGARCCPTNSWATKTMPAFKPLKCGVACYTAVGKWDNYPSRRKGSSDESNCLTGKWACKLGSKKDKCLLTWIKAGGILLTRREQELGLYSQPVSVQVLDLPFPHPSCVALSKLHQSLQFSTSSSAEWPVLCHFTSWVLVTSHHM